MSKTAVVHAQQVWEYHCISRTAENYLLNDLNEAGREGWELVSTQQHKNMKGATVWTAFLKRPHAGSKSPEGARAAAASAPSAGQGDAARMPAGFELTDGEFKLQD